MTSLQAAPSSPFDLKLPTLTITALLEAQHKNAAALGSANQAVFDGLKTLVQRQGFLFTASVDTYTRVTGDLLATGSVEERTTKQVDAARDAYVSIVARFRELSEIVIEANVTAMGIVNARIIEALGELKALFAPPVAASAATEEAPPPALVEPAATPEEVAAIEEPGFPVEPAPATVPAVSTIAPEAVAPEADAVAEAAPEAAAPEAAAPEAAAREATPIAVAATIPPETVAPPSEAAAAPAPPPKAAAPSTKAAAPSTKATASPARTTPPKTTPPRSPRRPTSRG